MKPLTPEATPTATPEFACALDIGNQQADLIAKAPRPVLARLERANDRMAAALSVATGMAVGRAVTTTDLAALEADAQVQPRVSSGQALLASLHRVGELGDANVI